MSRTSGELDFLSWLRVIGRGGWGRALPGSVEGQDLLRGGWGDSLAVQWLGLRPSTAGGTSCSKKKKKKEKEVGGTSWVGRPDN